MRLESDEQFTKFSAPGKETMSLVSLETMKDARLTNKMNSEQLPTVIVFDDSNQQRVADSSALAGNQSPLLDDPDSPWYKLSLLGDRPVNSKVIPDQPVDNDAMQDVQANPQNAASNQPKMLWSAERNIEMSQVGGRQDTQHFWPGADYVDEPEPDHSENEGNDFESIEELAKPVGDFARQVGNSLIAPETSINRGEVTAQQIDDWWRSAFSILERGHGDMNIRSDGF
ncbi:MAG: hypothetical protein U0103_14280 [Candidatus Obscuribacterales bacterium]|nr:hypothetical protein [Cyanobacteria bacterium SZAS LIN-5]RTL38002.1 MAG: hypothetical protein EKK48_22130 [Candidatus Melainabacteria bacterium]